MINFILAITMSTSFISFRFKFGQDRYHNAIAREHLECYVQGELVLIQPNNIPHERGIST